MALTYGVSKIKDGDEWKPLKGFWIKTESGWQEVKTGWVKDANGSWKRIYPTPQGNLTTDTSGLIFEVYNGYTSRPQTIQFVNSGDYVLGIQDLQATNGETYSAVLDLAGINGGTPFIMDPTGIGSIDVSVYGNSVGVSEGNITFINDTGYLGQSNVVIPITTTVLQNYNGITASPNQITQFSYYMDDTPPVTYITLKNSGNGDGLSISNITSTTGATIISNVPTELGFDWDTFTGNSAQFAITAAVLPEGIHTDSIVITSNSTYTPTLTIPVIVTVNVPHGSINWTTPGTYTWTVPLGVHRIDMAAVAGGGGGGGSTEVGDGAAGGGGGSGGVDIQTIHVWPGENLTITVGDGGAGSPYVGRDPGYSGAEGPGVTGGSTTITGNINGSVQTITVTGGGGGAPGVGVSGGGGKIICTKLYELGMLPKEIYEADQKFGAELVKTHPDIYNGYRAWAEIVVDWMSGNGPQMMFWIQDAEERRQAQISWSTRWAKEIATPWAEWMFDGKNKTGLALMAIGAPISKAVGVWQRWFGPSKKPAGFIKGLALINVFVLLRAVVAIGKLFGK